MQPYTPIGTLYAATALREKGLSVAVFDSMLAEPTATFSDILENIGQKSWLSMRMTSIFFQKCVSLA